MNRFTLSNGIRVIHTPVTTKPLVTVQAFIHGGVIDEKPEQAGLAQFTQSLLMQGTKTRTAGQMAREIEDIGGNISSDMEHDYGYFGISLMDNHAEKAFELLADILINPIFPDAEIEKERPNILAGIHSRSDQIFNVANDLFNRKFYGEHPYSWPDIGTEKTIAAITRDDIVAWHKKEYVAENLLLVVAGNIAGDEVKALAEKYFAAAPHGEKGSRRKPFTTPALTTYTETSRKFQQAYLMIGFPAPAIGDPEYPVLKVINALLGGRMSGRLFLELREKLSLAYEVNSYFPSRREMSRFSVYLGLKEENIELARKRIFELLNDLSVTPVSETELEETKTFIRGVYLLDHQTIGRQAWYIGWWEALGAGWEYDKKYLDELMAVSAKDIQRVAKQYLSGPSMQIEIRPSKNNGVH